MPVDWVFILGLAVASSIDNLAVGFSYGLAGLRIGIGSNLMIAVICFVFSEAGTQFGRWVGTLLPGSLPDIMGAVLLLLLGLRVLLLVMPRDGARGVGGDPQRRAVGNARSSAVGLAESLLLGVALSANALANAVGAGMLSLSPLAIALTAATGSLLTIAIGVELGLRAMRLRIGRFSFGRFGALVSGSILLGLVLARMIR
jgi:putative Mn2+ efflux pump MntP